MAAGFKITYIGGPTAIIEMGPIRLLTDPTFDPAGGKYSFGLGAGSTKTHGPAIEPEELGPIDAILLSHDQHGDNLDTRGRDVLPMAKQVLTTVSAEGRLGANAVGLRTWETARVVAPDGMALTVTATPARHGIPGSRPIVGESMGFILEWPGQEHGALYVSGDTVYHGRLEEIRQRFQLSVGILHFGGVQFPISGPARYTMTAAAGLKLAKMLDLRTVVPIHFEDWAHFREPQGKIAEVFASAGRGLLLQWPRRGEAIEVEV
jgi:L-ascorbate metabolism protein UlaG (beta-lactamase superfamily)